MGVLMFIIPCTARVGPEARPAAATVNSPVRNAHTGLQLTRVQFIGVSEVVTKSVTKKHNEIFFAKVSEAEIWTCVRRYLATFENEPGLTELDAAECRRNTPLCVSKRRHGGNAIAM